MKIIPYDKSIGQMSGLRDLIALRYLNYTIDSLPNFGLLVYEKQILVAAGFVRNVEGGFGFIDSYITNVLAPPSIRDEALSRLTTKLLKVVKHSGVTKLIGFTTDNHTLLRSLRHGFSQQDYNLITIDLTSVHGV